MPDDRGNSLGRVNLHFPVEVEVRSVQRHIERPTADLHFPVEVQVVERARVRSPGASVDEAATEAVAVRPELGSSARSESGTSYHFPVQVEVRAAPQVDVDSAREHTLASLARTLENSIVG